MIGQLVSVLMPCYNAEKYIEKAIESVLLQSYQNIEILCIDDGSEDSTANIINSLSKKDGRIKLISQCNKGVVEARRTGLNWAQGKYIALVDSDDFIESCAIEKAMESLSTNLAQAAVWEFWGTDGVERNKLIGYEKNGEIVTGKNAFIKTLDRWEINGFGVFCKAVYLKAYQLYDLENFNSYNADEFITRAALLNSEYVAKVKAKYFYFSNPESATRKFKISWLGALKTTNALRSLSIKFDIYQIVNIQLINKSVNESLGLLSEWDSNKKLLTASERLQCIKQCDNALSAFSVNEYAHWFLNSRLTYKRKIKTVYLLLVFKIKKYKK